jgi:ABC-type multidrug transport system permease subunit
MIIAAFLFTSSFAHLIIAGVPNEDIGGAIATVLGIMLYAFCGILSGPKDLPGFWIFMYRCNPFTYLVSGMLAATLGDAPAHCADNEYQIFFAPPNQTCGEYLANYMSMAGGYVQNPEAGGTEQCQFCQISSTNQYLESISVNFAERWRNFGLLWVYIVFNVAGAALLYWLCRVPKTKKNKVKSA